MKSFPDKLYEKLDKRSNNNAYRNLNSTFNGVDFSSNDYLGFSRNEAIYDRASEILVSHHLKQNGARGSRLLSGNFVLFELLEKTIATFHKVEASLIFNSGYDANLGFFSSIPQRGDFILYDELCHASIRDGITMSKAKAYKFSHNDVTSLIALIKKHQNTSAEIYIITEAVFSMDGDLAPLRDIVAVCKEYSCRLIVDEAHALGVFGESGEGLTQALGLEEQVFARIVTFGKALGAHGAAVLGSQQLKEYLINFCRTFIYTTALSPHSVATIMAAYEYLFKSIKYKQKLHVNIAILQLDIKLKNLSSFFIPSTSAIHSFLVSGNNEVKQIATQLQDLGFDVKPILSPTVAEGSERIRICLHSYNTEVQIKALIDHLISFKSEV